MAGKRKCVCCGEYIGTDEESVPYKGRYAHVKCFQITLKTIKKDKDEKLKEKVKNTKSKKISKPKVELKDPLSEEEYKEKKGYYDYLRQFFENEQIPSQVYAITDNQIKKYGFTFKNMHRTLVYIHEILGKELNNDVVGIIPYFYTEAIKYYESIAEIEERNKDIDTSTMYQEKTIFIKPKQRKNIQIDITSVGKEENDV